jgi:malic enzyme
MGEMRRAIAREREEYRQMDRFSSTIVIAASIIAALRLAREDISESNPRMQGVITQCVGLARMILKTVVR